MKTDTIFLIIGVIGLFALVMAITTGETHKEPTKCYDRFSNEIDGLVCHREINSSAVVMNIFASLAAISLFLALFNFTMDKLSGGNY